MEFRTFTIFRIVQESDTIKSFYLKRTDGSKVESYLPGQFVTVRVPNDSKGHITRNYTLSDAPDKGYFRLTIKRENLGESSRYFHDQLEADDAIEVSKPAGNFYLDSFTNDPIVLLSGGVGITPMLSILEHVLEDQPRRKVYFLHSSLDKNVQPMYTRLRELKAVFSNLSLSIHHSHPVEGETQGEDYDEKGFIGKEHLLKVFNNKKTDFYLCGPVGFMKTMYDYLQDFDVPKEQIRYEFFGEGEPLEGKPALKDSNSSLSSFKVSFEKSGKEAIWNNEFLSILEFAEAEGLQPEYSCRMGTCSTCETKILEGEIKYEPEPFMDAKEDHAYICCSVPASDLKINL